jgi:hypothetical protein
LYAVRLSKSDMSNKKQVRQVTVKVSGEERYPIYEPGSYGTEVVTDEATLFDWQCVLREFERVQKEMGNAVTAAERNVQTPAP